MGALEHRGQAELLQPGLCSGSYPWVGGGGRESWSEQFPWAPSDGVQRAAWSPCLPGLQAIKFFG